MEKEYKYLKSIAESLYGIHRELIRLNQTNPATKAEQAEPIEKPKSTKQLDPKNFCQSLLIEWWLFLCPKLADDNKSTYGIHSLQAINGGNT